MMISLFVALKPLFVVCFLSRICLIHDLWILNVVLSFNTCCVLVLLQLIFFAFDLICLTCVLATVGFWISTDVLVLVHILSI